MEGLNVATYFIRSDRAADMSNNAGELVFFFTGAKDPGEEERRWDMHSGSITV
jgi:hypothetical protein